MTSRVTNLICQLLAANLHWSKDVYSTTGWLWLGMMTAYGLLLSGVIIRQAQTDDDNPIQRGLVWVLLLGAGLVWQLLVWLTS